MVRIRVKKSLRVPLPFVPEGPVQQLPVPSRVAVDVSEHAQRRFVLLKKEGEDVALGEPVLADKRFPAIQFVAPASGTVRDIVRGDKRRILQVVIERRGDAVFAHEPLQGEQLPEKLARAGLFAHIRKRPGNMLPDPEKMPEAIFVKGVDAAPYAAPSFMEYAGREDLFHAGLAVLAQMAPVHVVVQDAALLRQTDGFQVHEAEGEYPSSHHSVHIHQISPVHDKHSNVWTLDFSGVIATGVMASKGTPYTERVFGIGGVAEPRYYLGCVGHPVDEMGVTFGDGRIISGDPLMGSVVGLDGFLGCNDRSIAEVNTHVHPEWLHFCGLGLSRFTATRTYLSRLIQKKQVPFTTQLHGEVRAFVDGEVYQKVMPMQIPVMELVKAVMAKDYDLAEELGLLEVAPEDFALPAFVCPSKIPMVDIVQQGLLEYAEQNF